MFMLVHLLISNPSPAQARGRGQGGRGSGVDGQALRTATAASAATLAEGHLGFGVLGILTRADNMDRRITVRKTWLSEIHRKDIVVRFLLDKRTPALWEEHQRHKDLMFLDSKYSGRAVRFGEKLALWLKLAHATWPNAAWVGKADDDIYICESAIMLIQAKLTPTAYLGWMHQLSLGSILSGLDAKDPAIGVDSNLLMRADEMFVILGSELVRRIAKRRYCDSDVDRTCGCKVQSADCDLQDTDYGGTSLAIWLSSYDDVDIVALNLFVAHSVPPQLVDACQRVVTQPATERKICDTHAVYHPCKSTSDIEKMFASLHNPSIVKPQANRSLVGERN